MNKLLFCLLLTLIGLSAQSQTTPVGATNKNPPLVIQNNSGSILKVATLTPCAGGTITISAGLSGSSYQWQVNDGSGWVNVTNGGVYSDATTPNLKITGAPTSLYGYQYRCNVNGNFSSVYVLKFVTTWNGSMDNTWENQYNWNCGTVPDANTDVIISSGSPVLNSVQSVRTLSSGFGVNVTIRPGATLTVAK